MVQTTDRASETSNTRHLLTMYDLIEEIGSYMATSVNFAQALMANASAFAKVTQASLDEMKEAREASASMEKIKIATTIIGIMVGVVALGGMGLSVGMGIQAAGQGAVGSTTTFVNAGVQAGTKSAAAITGLINGNIDVKMKAADVSAKNAEVVRSSSLESSQEASSAQSSDAETPTSVSRNLRQAQRRDGEMRIVR